jgi:hypothetical protein
MGLFFAVSHQPSFRLLSGSVCFSWQQLGGQEKPTVPELMPPALNLHCTVSLA